MTMVGATPAMLGTTPTMLGTTPTPHPQLMMDPVRMRQTPEELVYSKAVLAEIVENLEWEVRILTAQSVMCRYAPSPGAVWQFARVGIRPSMVGTYLW